MSWVFLAGPRAYKLKKPVRFPYLDFSTLARREAACRAELKLNRHMFEPVDLARRQRSDVAEVEQDRTLLEQRFDIESRIAGSPVDEHGWSIGRMRALVQTLEVHARQATRSIINPNSRPR